MERVTFNLDRLVELKLEYDGEVEYDISEEGGKEEPMILWYHGLPVVMHGETCKVIKKDKSNVWLQNVEDNTYIFPLPIETFKEVCFH